MRTLLLILFAATSALAAVTPVEYLDLQPKPQFKPGHRLLPLTRWGYTLGSNTTVVLARDWGYTLTLENFATPAKAADVTTPGTYSYGMAQLASNYPNTFKLSVLIDLTFTNPPAGYYCTNAAGEFVNNQGQVVPAGIIPSPEGPDSYWSDITDYWIHSLRVIQSNAPIAIILNGGEYGLNTGGQDHLAWRQDPRVQAATNGLSLLRYSSDRKAHQLGFLTRAIEQHFPNRSLYVFYSTSRENYRSYQVPGYIQWDDISMWGWDSDVMNTNTDLPSFEAYWSGNHGWTNAPGVHFSEISDLLTRYLNGVGYNLKLSASYSTNYNWVNAGSGGGFSEIERYQGFLRCLYTAGMVGGVAAYFEIPAGGFDATFLPNNPPHWLLQMTALSQVHAQFTYLEDYVWNGALIEGNGNMVAAAGVVLTGHAMSQDQSSYEFTNTVADATCRVLARKHNSKNEWLVCAWAADGTNRAVTVTIPTLGEITVTAADSGNLYSAIPGRVSLLNELGRRIDAKEMIVQGSMTINR